MIDCNEAEQILASEQKLSFLKRISLKAHLLMCRRCSVYERHVADLKKSTHLLLTKKSECCADRVRHIEEKVLNSLEIDDSIG